MNIAVEDFNKQIEKTIRLLEREEMLLQRKKIASGKSSDEERIVDEIKRYT